MNISRIEAFNPNKIVWAQLTAKQIINCHDKGIDVPDQYLEWAKEFIASVNSGDNDDVTYESAQNTSPTKTAVKSEEADNSKEQSEDGLVNNDSKSEPEEDTSTDTQSTDDTQENSEAAVQLSPAQQKRQDMIDNGDNLRTQAKEFKKSSKSTKKAAKRSSLKMKSLKNESSDEIQKLDFEMKLLMTKVKSKQRKIQEEVQSMGDNPDTTAIEKINNLQKELTKYGTLSQNVISDSEGKIEGNIDQINSQSDIISSASDFGGEAVIVGDELITQSDSENLWTKIVDRVIGKSTVKAGNKSIKASEKASGVQTNALQSGTENLSEAANYHTAIEDKTGVAAPKKQEDKSEEKSPSETDEDKNRKDNEKSIKVSNDTGTDKEDAKNINLDEILKRKVRNGEYGQNQE